MTFVRMINGIGIEYKATSLQGEFDGPKVGKTLIDLHKVLSAANAKKRADYEDLLSQFLDLRILVLKHIWNKASDGETVLACLADRKKPSDIQKLAQSLNATVEEARQIITFANPYVEEPKAVAV